MTRACSRARRTRPPLLPVLRALPVLPALFAPLALALLTACSSPGAPADTARPAPAGSSRPPPRAAEQMQFTETFEVYFDGDLVGYLVDVLPMPDGLVDQRNYLPGTKLIEGKDFEFLGFISPRGITYRFNEHGEAHVVGVGSVELGIAAFFQRTGPPTLVSTTPGVRSSTVTR